MKHNNRVNRLKAGIIAILTAAMLIPSIQALAATATVTATNVKIRESADTSSATVGSVTQGSTLDVISSTQAADGYTWYQVWVNGNQKGYVRGDLVNVEGSVSSTTAAQTTTTTTTTTTETATTALPETSVTPMDAQAGVISADSCNIRSGAGTGYSAVANVKKGTAVTLTGTAQGTDSKVWYQVSFVNNGATVTGFVRSDLVKVGEAGTTEEPAAPAEGEAPAEGAEGDVSANEETVAEETTAESEEPVQEGPQCDYEIVYADDTEGNSDWYLYNYSQGTRLKLNDVLNAATSNSSLIEEQASKISKLTIIIAILAVLLIAALIGATILFFKLREYSDDDDDDDDDEDDDDEDDDDDDDDDGYDDGPELFRRRKKNKESRSVRSQRSAQPASSGASSRSQGTAGKTAAPQGRTVQKTQLVRKADGTLVRRVITTSADAAPVAGSSKPRTSVQSTARPTTNKNAQNAVRNGASAAQAAKRSAQEDAQTLRDAQTELAASVKETVADTSKKATDEKNGVKWKSKNFLSDDDDLELTFLEDDHDE
ncbi:MAG: SH3 domain-containing protein [Lachnospiraceae bacterium]|nr:SH3 domain-containing protein [Lachnospiraceae bacterium]